MRDDASSNRRGNLCCSVVYIDQHHIWVESAIASLLLLFMLSAKAIRDEAERCQIVRAGSPQQPPMMAYMQRPYGPPQGGFLVRPGSMAAPAGSPYGPGMIYGPAPPGGFASPGGPRGPSPQMFAHPGRHSPCNCCQLMLPHACSLAIALDGNAGQLRCRMFQPSECS